ncbi:hypothetical protein ACLMJK_001977 [Lecanora helva]
MKLMFSVFYSLTTLVLGSLALNEESTFEGLVPISSLGEVWDHLSGEGVSQLDNSLQEVQGRAITFKPFSRVYNSGHLTQWIFGNTTYLNNISVPNCVKLGDRIGVYQFENDSMKYDATLGDIVTDLGIGTAKGTAARLAARTLTNALAAINEVQAFLKQDILKDSPSNLRRQVQFQSNGRILALVIKTSIGLVLGMTMAEVANNWNASGAKLTAGAVTCGALVNMYSIVDIVQQEGALARLEPGWMRDAAILVANIFMALLRRTVMLAQGAPDTGEPRWTESELQDYLQRTDIMSAWDPGATPDATPGTSSSLGIEGIVCEEAENLV